MTTTQETFVPADPVSLDAAITDLAAGIERWAGLGLAERADLLTATHASVREAAPVWAAAAVAAKRTPEALEGEEWVSGPYCTLSGLETMAGSLRALNADRSPLDGLRLGEGPGGRVTVRVLPTDLKEDLLLNGFTADVWLPEGVTAEEARSAAGVGARRVGEHGGVGVVLGAGNISAIGPLDALYELVAFNRASVLKLNPTFATLKPVLDRALAPLIEADLLRVVNGGAEVGGYLTDHPDVAHVHITGSAITHDAIVWGTGSEATERKQAGTPRLTKEITSELGGVSPIIVVPGRWSRADLRYQAEHVATQRLHNAGHNCIAGQTLVLSSEWDQKDDFLAELRAVLTELPPRAPWYPGSDAKLAGARAAYPDAEELGGRLLVEVGQDTSSELFSAEYFGPVLGHTTLPGTGTEFLRNAVDLANERLDGTLGASIIVDPSTRDAMGEELDAAITELRYGTIGVNVWSAVGFLLAGAPWGAYPGHTLDRVGSGIGIVHNGHLIADVEKTVAHGPFRPFPRSVLNRELTMAPKPPWFVTARTSTRANRALTAFAGKRSWGKLVGVAVHAIRG